MDSCSRQPLFLPLPAPLAPTAKTDVAPALRSITTVLDVEPQHGQSDQHLPRSQSTRRDSAVRSVGLLTTESSCASCNRSSSRSRRDRSRRSRFSRRRSRSGCARGGRARDSCARYGAADSGGLASAWGTSRRSLRVAATTGKRGAYFVQLIAEDAFESLTCLFRIVDEATQVDQELMAVKQLDRVTHQ